MKFQYLGTGAAEGFPAYFCECDTCQRAKKAGGKNIRRRSGAVINDTIMIDFPPDINWLSVELDLNLAKVHNIFFTHSHDDHFDIHDLVKRNSNAFVRPKDDSPIMVYGNKKVGEVFNYGLKVGFHETDNKVLLFTEMEAFKPITVEGVTFTAIPAEHDKRENCFIYLVQEGNTSFLYGNDTGLFSEPMYEFLKDKKLDIVSLDCTFAASKDEKEDGHMSIHGNQIVRKKLLELGCATEKTKWISHHFSHNGGYTYDEMVEIAKPLDITISYDGMVIETEQR